MEALHPEDASICVAAKSRNPPPLIANEFNRLRAFNKARLKKHAKIFGYIRKKTYLCKRKIKNEAP